MQILIRCTTMMTLAMIGLPALANAALDEYFVQTEWLAKNRTQVIVLDVRQTTAFEEGHVDGAHHVPRSEFLDKRSGVKSLVPTTIDFESLMGKLGITSETTVIIYAEDSNPYAARLAWTLHYYGHDKALILDGGYEKWATENRSISQLPTTAATPSTYRVSAPGSTRAEADYLMTQLGNPAVLIWDTRTPEEYEGSNIRADRGGHIPGATHLNWTELQHEIDGVKILKSEAEIRTLLTSHGITPDHEVIPHCQTGIRSSYATLVLLGLGYSQVKNYDGSWTEWANNPALPIASGAGKPQKEEISALRK